jgi:hypothetical protein
LKKYGLRVYSARVNSVIIISVIMLSKVLLILVCLLVLATSQINYSSRAPITGSSTNWLSYRGSTNAIYTIVNITSLGLKKRPIVTAVLSCTNICWTVTGMSSIYNLSPTGFEVYLTWTSVSPAYPGLTVAVANQWQYSLDYVIYPK